MKILGKTFGGARIDWTVPPGEERDPPRTSRRVLLGAAVALITVGAAMSLYPWFTNLLAARSQDRLVVQGIDPVRYASGTIREGEPLARLAIPSLDVDIMVVEGVTAESLEAGAGHYPGTVLPGEVGNVAIAGHRTTFGAPFADIERLRKGSKVVMTTPFERLTYEIVGTPEIVSPTDWSPIRKTPRGRSMLTLTSCHPEGSAAFRIVAQAELVNHIDVEPRSSVSAARDRREPFV